MGIYPRINTLYTYYSSSQVGDTGSDAQGRIINRHGIEFYDSDAFDGRSGFRDTGPGFDPRFLPRGATSIYEISCSAVSRSAGLLQTSSLGITTAAGSFIEIRNKSAQLNIVFVSSSISGSIPQGTETFVSASISSSRPRATNEIHVIRPKASSYQYFTASINSHTDSKGDNIATKLFSMLSASRARGLTFKNIGSTAASGSNKPNFIDPATTSSAASSSHGYIADTTYATDTPFSSSLHGSVVKIFSQRTGSTAIAFNAELTQSFGFTINQTQVGFGSRFVERRLPSERASPTASFRIVQADEIGQGLIITSMDESRSPNYFISGAHSTAMYISRSGAISILKEDPGVEFEVSGTISASGDIHGFSGSFKYITASIVDVDGDTIRVGGEIFNKTLLQNVKDGFDSDTRSTRPGANFKSGLNAEGNITASGDISASGTISGSILFANSLNIGSSFSVSSGGSITTLNNLNAGNSSTFDGHTITGRTTFTGNITASNNISSSGNLYANNVGPIYDDYIYLTPTDFAVDNQMAADGTITFDGGGIKDGGGRLKYFAQKVIPKGYKATRYKLFGSNPLATTNAYSSSYNEPSASATLGTSVVGTEKVLTGSIVGGDGTYISITWGARGLDELFGGYIKIERND